MRGVNFVGEINGNRDGNRWRDGIDLRSNVRLLFNGEPQVPPVSTIRWRITVVGGLWKRRRVSKHRRLRLADLIRSRHGGERGPLGCCRPLFVDPIVACPDGEGGWIAS